MWTIVLEIEDVGFRGWQQHCSLYNKQHLTASSLKWPQRLPILVLNGQNVLAIVFVPVSSIVLLPDPSTPTPSFCARVYGTSTYINVHTVLVHELRLYRTCSHNKGSIHSKKNPVAWYWKFRNELRCFSKYFQEYYTRCITRAALFFLNVPGTFFNATHQVKAIEIAIIEDDHQVEIGCLFLVICTYIGVLTSKSTK